MVGHEYNDRERGPTKIEVTNGGDGYMYKKVFTKPHADAEWVHHPEEDKKGELMVDDYVDSEGGKHEAVHRLDSTGHESPEMHSGHSHKHQVADGLPEDKRFLMHLDGALTSDRQTLNRWGSKDRDLQLVHQRTSLGQGGAASHTRGTVFKNHRTGESGRLNDQHHEHGSELEAERVRMNDMSDVGQ